VLDINPACPGHLLLLPKKHAAVMPQIDDADISHLFMVAKALSNVLLRALKAQGTHIFIANGAPAGQRAPHFMIHIIPRKENDGLNISLPQRKVTDEDNEKIQDALLQRIKGLFAIPDAEFEKLRSRPKITSEQPKPNESAAAAQQKMQGAQAAGASQEKHKQDAGASVQQEPGTSGKHVQAEDRNQHLNPDNSGQDDKSEKTQEDEQKEEGPAHSDLDLISRLFK
jgi:histidine triad (HIT) family protein